ncbi:phytanoyl-CoA dioxygenase family protein [Vulcaniibacterium thermophilum]|uniref:Phytanoyl-CoA dioxygenase n=1 Tax=Vulcaniibacterium thermophilum TaxID=1169913 RepID=A0A919DFS5_9GAMM|nr:phytanoyl-CoA dioxygenase family protein [Vulcaniibacterium thermophilum]GHE38753.1 phytanoyl-CoA dioxygenase [Vulcaniibacterium thermophilum]
MRPRTRPLDEAQLAQFARDGYCRVEGAFPRATARAACAVLWRRLEAMGLRRRDPASWRQPVVRLGMFAEPPFVAAANTPRLYRAFDQLVGSGRWQPCRAMGTFAVRFPCATPPQDTGWHVDMSLYDGAASLLDWRIDRHSTGRALLMLFLFSDVGERDAPTRLLAGSHRRVARLLEPAGERGLSLRELSPHLERMTGLPQALATGEAGTVYLCHPFLVHAAQAHHGATPRFMAQPPLLPRPCPTAAPGRLHADIT